MIADNIIYRDTNGKGNSTVNSLAVHLLGKQFLGLGCDDGVSEFTQVNDLGARKALADEPLEGKVDNLGSFLIFCTNITEGGSSID